MHPITMRLAPFAAIIALNLPAALASANTVSWVNVPIPAGTAVTAGSSGATGSLDGFRSFDLTLSTTGDWEAAALLIELAGGQIFQEAEGGGFNGTTLGQPNPSLLGVFPSSQFDTHIFDPHGGAVIAGAGGDAGGDIQQFDSAEIDISWASAVADTADVGTFSIARITLSDDAQGTVSISFTAADVGKPITAISSSFPSPNPQHSPRWAWAGWG